MKKNNTWFKVVVGIIILELVIGGVIFAYKKLNSSSSNSISIKDERVSSLYEKIAYADLDIMDIMSPSAKLYYGYKNLDKKESISCDVLNITDDTTGYHCDGVVDFLPSASLENTIKDIYGDNTTAENISFEIDPNHYAFYDTTMNGYAIFTKNEEVSVDPVNLNLKAASLDDDDNIILTVEVLDGVIGTLKNTYNYTFVKDGKNYYLSSRETVAS